MRDVEVVSWGRKDEALVEMSEPAMTELGACDPHVAEEPGHPQAVESMVRRAWR